MAPLRVGLVGVGFAGKAHLANLRRVHGLEVEVSAVTSARAASRDAFARVYGLRAVADVSAMLPLVDVVDICSPPSHHEEAILLAAGAGKHVICEKPLSGYFGPAAGCHALTSSPGEALAKSGPLGRACVRRTTRTCPSAKTRKGMAPNAAAPDTAPGSPVTTNDDWRGDLAPKGPMLSAVVEHLGKLASAVRKSGVTFCYAENFVYAPTVQKEREIVEKSGARLLRMIGEESHSGSTSPVYGIWRFAGGGSLMGKGCHPLTALLYLKRVEGIARKGKPIRPRSVTCRCEKLTKLDGFQDKGFLRTGYRDIEDHCWAHVTFEDGTVGDVIAGEVVMGGLYSYIEVFADNHRTRCNLSPAALMETFNPSGPQFKDIYTVEKIGTKEGWAALAPDEGYTLGVQGEMQDFLTCIARGGRPQSDLELALDTITTIYAAYVSDEKGGCVQDVPLL